MSCMKIHMGTCTHVDKQKSNKKKDSNAKSYTYPQSLLLPSPLRPDSGTDLGSNLMVTKPLGGLGKRHWAKHVFRADNISNHHLTPKQRKGHIPLPPFSSAEGKNERKKCLTDNIVK